MSSDRYNTKISMLSTTAVVVWQTPESNHICDAVSLTSTWFVYIVQLYIVVFYTFVAG